MSGHVKNVVENLVLSRKKQVLSKFDIMEFSLYTTYTHSHKRGLL